jgi:hypothetical protein
MDGDDPDAFAPLDETQATVLALWTLGMVLARSCALTAVSVFLATWLSRKEQTVRQQWREFCYNVSSLPIMEKGKQFLRVIGIFALLCSHYKISLLRK